MNTPTRKPIKLAGNGLASVIANTNGDRIDLGIACLKHGLDGMGWTARTPDDDRTDRKPRATHQCECGTLLVGSTAVRYHADETGHQQIDVIEADTIVIDYTDPTGDLAVANERMHDDLCEIQDLQRTATHAFKRLTALAARYIPTATGDPRCSRNGCEDTVERTKDGRGFRGCKLVSGIWCASEEKDPVCRSHRAARERAEQREAEARAEYNDQHTRKAS